MFTFIENTSCKNRVSLLYLMLLFNIIIVIDNILSAHSILMIKTMQPLKCSGVNLYFLFLQNTQSLLAILYIHNAFVYASL